MAPSLVTSTVPVPLPMPHRILSIPCELGRIILVLGVAFVCLYLGPKGGLDEITNGHGANETGETSDLSLFFVGALLEHPEGVQARHLADGLRSLERRGVLFNIEVSWVQNHNTMCAQRQPKYAGQGLKGLKI